MGEQEFAIGAMVSCPDGFCGRVTGLIIDSSASTLTHLVVEHKHGHKPGRLVPLHLVDSVDSAGGEVRLRCTIVEFDQLDPAEEVELIEDAGSGYGDAGSRQWYGAAGGFGTGMPASGMKSSMIMGRRRTIVQDAVPLGETEVGRGEHVQALDGQIGQVEGFLIKEGSGEQRVTHVLLQEGHLWGHREIAIPISAVSHVEGGIHLNLTKQQVEDLPPLG